MVANVQNNIMMNRYVDVVCTFATADFADPAIQDNMVICLFNAKKTMTGVCLCKNFLSWRKEVCMQYASNLLNNMSCSPSGQQLSDIYKKFLLDHFKEENESRSICFLMHVFVSSCNSFYLRIWFKQMMLK